MYQNPGIAFDTSRFQPMQIMPVTHTLMGHPLLQLDSLIELAKRLERTGSVRAHNGAAAPDTSFATAPESHPIKESVQETIRRIESSNAWMALHNIQNDPTYRKLVDEVLDYVRPAVEPKDPGMCHRAGWIFVTSPNAVTPYHLDHEHNFILQVLGEKTIHVFDPLDRSITSNRALELFHMQHSRELVVYRDELAPKAHVFEAKPGMGAYMPSTAPHWVKNGNNVSITVSFTYYTRRTLAQKAAFRANATLRSLGLSPEDVGQSKLGDWVKARLQQTRQGALQTLRRKPPHPILSTDKYATE
jgi:hypothetical protein